MKNNRYREIYINASKVFYFTKFNKFVKENEDVMILCEYNTWLNQYIHFNQVNHHEDIIEKINDKVNIIKQIDEAISAESEVYINSIQDIDLKDRIEEYIRTQRGIIKEKRDINNLTSKIKEDNSFYKKELFSFEYNDYIYKVIVGGKIDGYVDSETILETKHRRYKLFNFIPDYEKVQIEIYLFLLNFKKCLHVENFNGLKNEKEYIHNEVFLQEIKKELQEYLITLFKKYL